ncbi:OmpA family protein [Lutibacter oricola]|uniref:OmpA family protein n=1 Tax=Lutibacter oricola TaxID=762486 RepID=A0A1H2R6Y6_9FLAO|nr:OmpA family protein [Lutibacter oricola]SDW15212.1 OmpA family protein [Lutibacter oricola]
MKNQQSKFKNKLLFKLLLVIGLLFAAPQQVEAQFFKNLKEKAEKKIKREAEKRSERRVNKKIDKTFDDAEDILDGKKKKKKTTKKEKASKTKTDKNSNNINEVKKDKVKKPNVSWSRFDFVPGDTVLFEDGPNINEDNGEFPSRWDIVKGNCEIVNVNGENVIAFPKGGTIIPYLKNSKNDYLPEVFTIELDAWFYTDTNQRDFYISFYDKKNQRHDNSNYKSVRVNSFSASFDNSYQVIPKVNTNGMWRHVSIAYTKGKLKVYLDETRLINIPHMEGNPTGITIEFNGYSADKPDQLQYIKNVSIAKGGVKYYDRVLSEGKIIVNGIKFDVNKATLKPESMGPINKIYQLMQKNTDINFSVEGHTDSDGSDEANMTLSKARGKSVMNKLIEMGISANRLKSNGFGESKPIDNNSTPEGKANNRRVEFVKYSSTGNSQ